MKDEGSTFIFVFRVSIHLNLTDLCDKSAAWKLQVTNASAWVVKARRWFDMRSLRMAELPRPSEIPKDPWRHRLSQALKTSKSPDIGHQALMFWTLIRVLDMPSGLFWSEDAMEPAACWTLRATVFELIRAKLLGWALQLFSSSWALWLRKKNPKLRTFCNETTND